MLKVLNYNTKTFPEGCGSVCGYTGDVKRFEEVQLSGHNENGDVIELHLRNWNARIAQHEVTDKFHSIFTQSFYEYVIQCLFSFFKFSG